MDVRMPQGIAFSSSASDQAQKIQVFLICRYSKMAHIVPHRIHRIGRWVSEGQNCRGGARWATGGDGIDRPPTNRRRPSHIIAVVGVVILCYGYFFFGRHGLKVVVRESYPESVMRKWSGSCCCHLSKVDYREQEECGFNARRSCVRIDLQHLID